MNNEICLILSDIHNRVDRVDKIINSVVADKIILLMDAFDNFGDSHIDATKTANWVKNSLKQENRVHLFSNHDIGYAFPNNPYTRCSGWTGSKQEAIDQILTAEDWSKLKFFHFEQGWLFTHAGLDRGFYDSELGQLEGFLESESKNALRSLKNNKSHWLFRAGYSRGGTQPKGGSLWCDANDEFEPIGGVRQCFGHSPQREPLWIDKDNLCLDTHSNHWAILKDGEIKTYAYADL